MNKLAALAALAALSFDASSMTTEADYVKNHCKGVIEKVLPDKTRVDCLTNTHAIEYDYGHKWAEAIGQSLFYAAMTNRKAGIVLIVKPETKLKYSNRLRRAIIYNNLKINVEIVTIKDHE
ncbi:MAG: hypothetical protein GY829_05795 [Gammaproteobacteria bacterium]|nr:hypothetical protein [Gammaproteobacteria bacterium]